MLIIPYNFSFSSAKFFRPVSDEYILSYLELFLNVLEAMNGSGCLIVPFFGGNTRRYDSKALVMVVFE